MSIELRMEDKSKQSLGVASGGQKSAKDKTSIVNHIRDLKEELKKVSWTTRAELKLFTKVVLGVTFLFGLGIYIVDLLIKGALDGFGILVHFIFG